jgi:predicted TIM-barrel fold metal-dependent hydrolase
MEIEDTLRTMDAHDVSRAVLSSAGEYAALLNTEGNRQIADAVRGHPLRFNGFATINPWWRAKGLDELRRCREEYGFAGLVLHPILQGFEANDPLVFELVESAITYGMIVYVTGGAPYLAMPYKIADLAGRYPEGRFVMGHAGWDFHFDVPYCLEACPNLWAETSRNGLANMESLVRKFGAARLLFGSDLPFSSYETEIAKIRLLPDLTEIERQKIFYDNAHDLLNLESMA